MVRTGRPVTGQAKGEMLRIRFDTETLKRLDAVVIKRKSNRSELIREAVIAIIKSEEDEHDK